MENISLKFYQFGVEKRIQIFDTISQSESYHEFDRDELRKVLRALFNMKRA